MKIPVSVLVVLYIVAGFATFGWTFNTIKPDIQCYVNPDGTVSNRCFETANRSGWALTDGVFWPLYWAGTLSIRYVHP